MRRFSLFKRRGERFFYAQIRNPETGKYLPPKSTHATDQSEAALVVAAWLRDGLPAGRAGRRSAGEALARDTLFYNLKTLPLTPEDAGRILEIMKSRGLVESAVLADDGPGTEPLLAFLTRFWDFDCSPYVKEKLAYGQSIGRRHCYEQTRRLQRWEVFFPGVRLREVSRERLRAFQLWLKEKGLASKTVNAIVTAGTVPLKWATDAGTIPGDPGKGLRKFSGKAAKRGILSPEEAARLFASPWADERGRVGNLVAMSTGLRAGEVLALQREDIGPDRLHVRHSWSFADGLKCTKTGEERVVPLLAEVREELLALAGKNPYGTEGRFIFYGVDPKKPCNVDTLNRELTRALVDLALPEAECGDPEKREQARKEIIARGICFHSWRHFYAKHIADRVEARIAKLGTGHATGAMLEHYADHQGAEDFQKLAAGATEAFGKILEFRKPEKRDEKRSA